MNSPARSPASLATSEPVFHVRGLTKVYGTGTAEVRALAGVDLDLHAGDLVVLLGPSGSGKTTLLNQLGGLDIPTAGELRYRDIDLTHATEEQLTNYRRESVGFIFQFCNLIPSLTARENVGLITEIARNPFPAEQALDMVGLTPRLDHFPAQLSGGEQQRVAIARALASGARILLADEPTGNLDQETGEQIIKLLFELKKQEGASLLLITHDRALAKRCDRIAEVRDGKIISGNHP